MTRPIKIASLKRPASSKEGVWIAAAGLPGVEFRVRPANCAEYRAAVANATAMQPPRQSLSAADIVRGDVEDGALIADHLLTGWRGFDAAYSTETAKALLTDPDHGELRGHVVQAARRAADVHFEFVEAAEGN